VTQLPKALSAFFETEQWSVEPIDDAPVPAARGGFQGESGEWFVDAFWFPADEQLVVLSVAPKPVPEDRCAPVAGDLTFVNYGLPVGNFELSPLTGDLRCKTSVSIAEADLTEDLVARQVYANVALMDRYLPGVVQVVWGTDPGDAYAAIDG